MSLPRSIAIRIVAILLLLIATGEVYACDMSDACAGGPADQTSQQSGDCDQALGDNCLCCCHHVVPVAIFVLEPAEHVFDRPLPPLTVCLGSLPSNIDHPPQL